MAEYKLTGAQKEAKSAYMKERYKGIAAKKLRDRTLTYNIFGKDITLPKGFTFGSGTKLSQNKKSVEEGFRKLEQWFKNPTTEHWSKLFGRNNNFALLLRNYS